MISRRLVWLVLYSLNADFRGASKENASRSVKLATTNRIGDLLLQLHCYTFGRLENAIALAYSALIFLP